MTRRYETRYGLGRRPPHSHTFVDNYRMPLIHSDRQFRYFTRSIEESKRERSDLILALRCWDAITAHDVVFVARASIRNAPDSDVAIHQETLVNRPRRLAGIFERNELTFIESANFTTAWPRCANPQHEDGERVSVS